MPAIRFLDPGPRHSTVALACGHVRIIVHEPYRPLPKIGEVWPCLRCTPKENELGELLKSMIKPASFNTMFDSGIGRTTTFGYKGGPR